MEHGLPCNGDNPDALYGNDIGKFVPQSRADKILIVGIDHVGTGKTSYVSHAVLNVANQVGVIAADDLWLKGSGLVMGKVAGPDDPRHGTFSRLYAFTISYDCSGEPVCLQIPEPTADDPVGVPFGDEFGVTARYYLDPATNTRPSMNEVISHRVFKLSSK